MNIQDIKNNFLDAQKVLNDFIANETNFEKIQTAANIIAESLANENKVISCGNGGSMSDAMHFAEELTGRFRENRPALAATCISDPTHITCVGNDFGFDYIFSKYVEGVGKKGDVLFAISTSGNSKNIINAVKSAKLKGMKTIALTGKTGGELAKIADCEIRVEWNQYSDRIQEIHIKIIHTIIQYIESKMNF
ncbi:MAG: D-sedoheptulose 7-phosphate isomerase [Marinifilaceae bacterium]|jgi:D-sedoheptulose 7-phosphate isomerase|nr:D-sedoheptulose 7-phosphate isomerase [Marinifilaceae bacterium]